MKNANDKARETTELALNWRELFFVLSRAWKKKKFLWGIKLLNRMRSNVPLFNDLE